MDVSAQHSIGWQMQQPIEIHPNLNGDPPTAQECPSFKPALQRVERFYAEGEDKQGFMMKEVERDKQTFQKMEERIQLQLKDLEKYPPSHTRRKLLEEDLNKELEYVRLELKARHKAREKLELLYKKREEFVSTMNFLNAILDKHCNQFKNQ